MVIVVFLFSFRIRRSDRGRTFDGRINAIYREIIVILRVFFCLVPPDKSNSMVLFNFQFYAYWQQNKRSMISCVAYLSRQAHGHTAYCECSEVRRCIFHSLLLRTNDSSYVFILLVLACVFVLTECHRAHR